MILFSFPCYDHMAQPLLRLPFLKSGHFAFNRFPNAELYVTVSSPVRREYSVILGSVTPPDEQLLVVMLLAHTLKKEGAARVTALLPYLAYSRQDKDKPGESLAAAWVGSLFKSSGLDEVITVDLHSEKDKQLFPLPITSIPTSRLFAETVCKHGLTKATLVAPDNGAISRCQAVKAAANLSGEVVYLEKKRTLHGITHTPYTGDLSSRAIIIDDMLDTGGTLLSTCKILAERSVQEIYIMVTHGLFTGDHWQKLWSLRVKNLFCTDTLPFPEDLETKRILRLSVIPLLQKYLEEVQLR